MAPAKRQKTAVDTQAEPAAKAAPKEAPKAAGSAALVPVDVPAPSAATQSASPPKPVLPSCSDADVDVPTLMRGIIRFVQYHLKIHMKDNPQFFSAFPNTELNAHQPLPIKSASSDNDLLSYKAPWSQDLAAVALASTHMYEAGGNIFWINPFVDGADENICAGESQSWELVHAMADVFRLNDDEQGASTPLAGTLAKERRLKFSVIFPVYGDKVDVFGKHHTFPGTMRLATGHVALWGWYLAALEALDASNTALVALLWQAALTATIQANVVTDTSVLALLSMKSNNELFVNAKCMMDSFPGFARKLNVAMTRQRSASPPSSVAARLTFCGQHDIRYNQAAVHRTLLLAACKYIEVVSDETHGKIMRLERRFGRDALNSKWNNLNRLLQLCCKEAEGASQMWNGLTASDLVSHVLEHITWALENDEVQTSSITQEWLDKARNGTPGCVARVLAKLQLVANCEGLVAELPATSKTKATLECVLKHFVSYGSYNKAFATRSPSASTPGGDASVAEPQPLADDDQEAEEDPFEKMRAGLCKTGGMVLDFLFDLYAGEHDKDLNELLKKHSCCAALLPWTEWEGAAGKAWREVTRQLGVHKQVVSATTPGALPPQSHRSLKRVLTEDGGEDDDRTAAMRQEREETWKSAQTARKKYALVSHAVGRKSADLQAWFERQRNAYHFVGKAGESHRIFIFSADTAESEGEEPWKCTTDSKHLDVVLEFMKAQTGPCDVLLCFDGRNKADRAALAASLEECRNLCELWLIYNSTKRLGRRVAWSSDTREVGWLSLPVPRTALAIKERDGTTAGWGETTHDTVYSGVDAVPWDGLPMISAEDKVRVMGIKTSASTPGQDEVPLPDSKIFDADRGMPLYWAERKPVAFWEDILWSVDAAMVVDLSPGSGSAGRACLRAGIQYVACCHSEAHASWVGNILDREACEIAVTSGSPLFEQDMASMLGKHFKDVLAQLEEQANAEDKEPEGEIA